MRTLMYLSFVVLAACSSEDAAGGGTAAPTLDRTKQITAAVEADLPLVCDAWAESVGGYGQPDKKKDCGNAFASAYPPSSREECVASLKSKDVAECEATIDDFLACEKATYADPCVKIGDARSCFTVGYTSCWR